MKVRAIKLGYYGHERRQEGQEFTLEPIKRLRKDKKTGQMKEILISAEQQFSERWMERLTPPSKPVKEKQPAAEVETTESGI